MDWKLFWIFVILNIVNVIIQTIKSIATVKCGKGMAAFVNAVAYGLYTVVVVYMVCDLPLWLKVVVIAICNLVGVFFVKWGEEKARKDKLWKVEATIPSYNTALLHKELTECEVKHNYVENIGNWTIFNLYCPNQEYSKTAKRILDRYGAKYFVSESKTL